MWISLKSHMKIVITCFTFLLIALLALFAIFQGQHKRYFGAASSPELSTPDLLPSSLQVNRDMVKGLIPVVSVVIDEEHLYNPDTGIFANWREKGREWEVPASVSYYNRGLLLFASEVGVRVHGGTSRRLPRRSLRLYFRPEYGEDRFLPGLLYNDHSSKFDRLILHNDRRRTWRVINPLSYDLTREIGGIAPRTTPVSLSLNGKDMSLYFLTERLGPRFLQNKYKHRNFDFVRYTGRLDNVDNHPKSYRDLVTWARDRDTPMTLEKARKHVDVENLALWALAQAYVGNSDPFQGMAVRDKSLNRPRWFWVSWDMDHGFRTRGGYKDVEPYKKGSFEYILNRRPLRSQILTRLTNESPEFRHYFRSLVFERLNHRLTQDYLLSRCHYYEKVLRAHQVEDLDFLAEMKEFIEHRADYLRERMKEFFQAKEAHLTRVKVPAGTEYHVDGYPKKTNYKGWYEAGSTIVLDMSGNWTFSHWLINGKDKVKGSTLSYVVNAETEIEAVFR